MFERHAPEDAWRSVQRVRAAKRGKGLRPTFSAQAEAAPPIDQHRARRSHQLLHRRGLGPFRQSCHRASCESDLWRRPEIGQPGIGLCLSAEQQHKKLSEHVFGNALGIAGFTLSNSTTINIEQTPPEKNEKFLAAIRNATCVPFKTTIDPSRDADPALSLLLRSHARRNGGTLCQ